MRLVFSLKCVCFFIAIEVGARTWLVYVHEHEGGDVYMHEHEEGDVLDCWCVVKT